MEEVQFESLETYLSIAKKIIGRFVPTISPVLATKMLRSDDAISHVANAIMNADYKWNPEYRSQNNTVKSKYSYRNQRAIWAIRGWIHIQKKENAHRALSLSYVQNENNEESLPLSGIIPDKTAINPAEYVADKEEKQYIGMLINGVVDSEVLTKKQAKYLRGYYLEGKTLAAVGREYGVSREAVRQGITKGIQNLKDLI